MSVPTSSSFSTDQKEWLDGFLKAASHLSGAPLDDAPCPYPCEASAGYRAQTRWLAEGRRLSREEDIKRRRNPLLFRSRLTELDGEGGVPTGEENFLARFHGIFNVEPTQDRPMCRMRIPGGILNDLQAQAIARLSRECADGTVWLTTRGNIQVRNILPGLMSEVLVRLEETGLGAKGSGADNIRNVVGNPTAGIDPQELLDVRPLVRQWHHHILQEPDLYGLPRKFNVAFDGGGCVSALEETNDVGLRACFVPDRPDVQLRLLLGGITGHRDFARDSGIVLALTEWLPAVRAILDLFVEHGDRGQRSKARFKYLLDAWGTERFLEALQERLPFALRRIEAGACRFAPEPDRAAHLGQHPQKQPDLCWLGVHVPVGKLTSEQFSGLAGIARRHGDGDLRLTVWQNLLLSGIPFGKASEVRAELEELDLRCGADGALQGLVACTGSEGCRHGLAATKRTALAIESALAGLVPPESPVNIHVTGCPHSCAQHLAADIGLVGTGIDVAGIRQDGFHIVFGGTTGHAPAIASALRSSVPATDVPPLLRSIVQRWLERRAPSETFSAFCARHDSATLSQIFA
jgi:ferredoxin-nitrite reductase